MTSPGHTPRPRPFARFARASWLSRRRGLQLLGGLFLVGAALQYNDDVPWLWAGLYLTTALLCLSAAAGALAWPLPAGWSAALGGGALWQHVREEEPCWQNLGCLIGSDVPGLVVNAAVAAALALRLVRDSARRDCPAAKMS